MFVKYLSVILCISSLAACVSMPEPHWEKAGISRKITKMDEAKCKYDVGMRRMTPAEKQELIESCMIMKGYEWIGYQY